MLHTSFHRPRPAAHVVGVVFCASVALLLLLSGSAHGQAAASTTPSKGEATPLPSTVSNPGSTDTTSTTGSHGLVRTIVGLAIVIAVIYGITWVLKQTKKKVTGSEDDFGTGLEPTAALTLTPGAGLHLVRVGEEYLLLGVTTGGVNQIRSYTQDEARDAGFRVDDDEVDTLRPLGKDRIQTTVASTVVERLRDMTVRR